MPDASTPAQNDVERAGPDTAERKFGYLSRSARRRYPNVLTDLAREPKADLPMPRDSAGPLSVEPPEAVVATLPQKPGAVSA